MELGNQQKIAFDKISQWYLKGHSKYFTLAGYAGTGKTTLAKYISKELAPNSVFCAYTGKAAKVLREKGCANASTVHGLIYSLLGEDDKGNPVFGYDPSNGLDKRLIIVDEYSMLSKEIIDDLVRTGEKILFLGDPFQLGPVKPKTQENIFELTPDFFLDEVHRQALDSEIIRFATDVRNGKLIPKYKGIDFEHVSKKEINLEDALNVEQVIVGLIKTKQSLNEKIREGLNFPKNCFAEGDKIISLRNDKNKGLLNGAIGACKNVENMGHYTRLDFHCGIDVFENLKVWNGIVEGKDAKEYNFRSGLENFEHAYAITCHKSQGSEFDTVLIFNEAWGSPMDRQRWLYTAITRAKNKAILVDIND